jgi:hypothetical protein
VSPFFKALIGVVVVAVIAAFAITVQYKAGSSGSNEPVGLTQDEMSMFVEKNLGFRERAQLANDPAARKTMLEKLGKQLKVVAEANRRGLGNTEEFRALDELTTAQILQDAYFEAHPELAKSAQASPHGPQASPEEANAWIAAHGDDITRYQQAISTTQKGAPAPKPENFASAFVFADKARAEGLDKQPDTQLQLKLGRYGLLYQQMDAKLEEETKVSDDEARKYYDEHKPTGDLDQVHVQHILLATVAMPSPTNMNGAAPDPEAKRQLADQLLQRVKNGEDFAELAKQFSDDPGSKDKGGDLGWSERFKYVPQFEEVAWKLQPGQISDVVKTDYGFHIIKMLERKPPEEATPQTLEKLKESLSQRRFEDTLNEIAEHNTVKLPDDFTVTVPEMPPGMPTMPGGMGGPGGPAPEGMGEDEDLEPAPAAPPAGKAEGGKAAGKAPAKAPAKAEPAKKGTK